MSVRRPARALKVCVFACVALGATAALARAAETPPRSYVNLREMTTRVPILTSGKLTLTSSVLGEVHCSNTFYSYGWNEHEHGQASNPVRAYGEVVGLTTSSCQAPQVEASALEKKEKATVTVSAELPLERVQRQAVVCKEEKKVKLSECANDEERETKTVTWKVRRRIASFPWKLEMVRGEREEEPVILEKMGLHAFGEAGTATGQSTKCYPKEKAVVEGKEVERSATFTKVPAGCVAVNVIVPQIPLEVVYYGTLEVLESNGFGNGLNASRLQFAQAGKLFSSQDAAGEGEATGTIHAIGAESVELITAK